VNSTLRVQRDGERDDEEPEAQPRGAAGERLWLLGAQGWKVVIVS
jgi:hypothetical protein